MIDKILWNKRCTRPTKAIRIVILLIEYQKFFDISSYFIKRHVNVNLQNVIQNLRDRTHVGELQRWCLSIIDNHCILWRKNYMHWKKAKIWVNKLILYLNIANNKFILIYLYFSSITKPETEVIYIPLCRADFVRPGKKTVGPIFGLQSDIKRPSATWRKNGGFLCRKACRTAFMWSGK